MSITADFYEPYLHELGAGDADSRDTIDFYVERIGSPRQRILDIGAGTGRISIPLAALGHEVVALDRSAQMLEALNRRSHSTLASGALRVVCRPFGPRAGEALVDVAIAPDDFLLHLTSPEELASFFVDLASWLRAGGRFVTDVRSRNIQDLEDAAHPPFVVRTFPLVKDELGSGGVFYVHVAYWEYYRPLTRILETTCQYQMLGAGGDVIRSTFRVLRQRVHTNAEIVQMATDAGFTLAEHTERNQTLKPTTRAIGGTFVFVL